MHFGVSIRSTGVVDIPRDGSTNLSIDHPAVVYRNQMFIVDRFRVGVARVQQWAKIPNDRVSLRNRLRRKKPETSREGPIRYGFRFEILGMDGMFRELVWSG
jgi:hypothetical protein